MSGVYRDGTSELRLQALNPNKLKFEFKFDWTIVGYYLNDGYHPNTGDAVGETTIEGNVARLISGDTKKCTITLTFLTNRIEVTHEGPAADCGYKHNVVAAGTSIAESKAATPDSFACGNKSGPGVPP